MEKISGLAKHHRWLNLILIFIAWTGGSTDAISYAGLGHVFAANMTGHTVLLALAFSGAEGLSVSRTCAALAAFLGGALIGAIVVKGASAEENKFRKLILAIRIESACLLLLAIGWYFVATTTGWQIYALIVLAGVAMGVQSAAVLNLGLPGVATTYITGMYTKFVTDIVDGIGKLGGSAARADRGSKLAEDDLPHRNLGIQAAILLAYGTGAVAGGWSLVAFPLFAPLVPLVSISLVVACEFALGRSGAKRTS